jgi:hypothetical protein
MMGTEEEEQKNEQNQEEALEIQKSECLLSNQIDNSCCGDDSIVFVSVVEGVHQDEPEFEDEADGEEYLVAR